MINISYLAKIFLPVSDECRTNQVADSILAETDLLTARFGGATSFVHSAAEGYLKDSAGRSTKDVVVLIEVLVDQWDQPWWGIYKQDLDKRFQQQEILIRRLHCEVVT